jgi:hypothetical protein
MICAKNKHNKMDKIKENMIREYLSLVNFKNDNWSLSQIKSDLKSLLGEEPNVDVIYKKDTIINEATSEEIKVESVEKLNIIFSDEKNNKLFFKKIEVMV